MAARPRPPPARERARVRPLAHARSRRHALVVALQADLLQRHVLARALRAREGGMGEAAAWRDGGGAAAGARPRSRRHTRAHLVARLVDDTVGALAHRLFDLREAGGEAAGAARAGWRVAAAPPSGRGSRVGARERNGPHRRHQRPHARARAPTRTFWYLANMPVPAGTVAIVLRECARCDENGASNECLACAPREPNLQMKARGIFRSAAARAASPVGGHRQPAPHHPSPL